MVRDGTADALTPGALESTVGSMPSLFDDEALDEGDEFGFRQGFGYDVTALGILDGPTELMLGVGHDYGLWTDRI